MDIKFYLYKYLTRLPCARVLTVRDNAITVEIGNNYPRQHKFYRIEIWNEMQLIYLYEMIPIEIYTTGTTWQREEMPLETWSY